MLKKQKGITLIALIVTIIVLLILAGVSIAMITGENGIATKATASKTKTAEAGEKESVSMAVSTAVLEGNGTIETDAEGKIVSDEVKTVLNNELKKIGYEGEEITKLPTEVEMAYNTYYIDEFGSISIYEPGKTLNTNLDDFAEILAIMSSDMSSYDYGKITYRSGVSSLEVSSASGTTFGSYTNVYVTYIDEQGITSRYAICNTENPWTIEMHESMDGCGYPYLPNGVWSTPSEETFIDLSGTECIIYSSITKMPKFVGEWKIDEENSTSDGIKYLSKVLIDY